MEKSNFVFESENVQINIHKWMPNTEDKLKGVVQIVHGMVEHGGRYDSFAKKLTTEGFIVYAEDHRGHGKTSVAMDDLGHLNYPKDWDKIIADIHRLNNHIKQDYPTIPFFLFGHSMGSFLTRQYLYLHGNELNGVILSGIGYPPNLLLNLGIVISRLEIMFRGSKYRSSFLDKLTFGSNNRRIKSARTKFDWLSNNNEEVEKYINDVYCGVMCTAGFFYNLFNGIKELQKTSNMQKTPKETPILIISGDEDPVGDYGKAATKLYEQYNKLGLHDIHLKVYKNGRHELLNDIDRATVMEDVIRWFKKHASIY